MAAEDADDLWCASLVCASATAAALEVSSAGPPAYVVTGRFPDHPAGGDDDLACAELIEALRTGSAVDPATHVRRVVDSEEAARTLRLGDGHVHPEDIAYAARVDRFGFALRARRGPGYVQVVAEH